MFLLQMLNTFMLLFFRNEGRTADIEMYYFHYMRIFRHVDIIRTLGLNEGCYTEDINHTLIIRLLVVRGQKWEGVTKINHIWLLPQLSLGLISVHFCQCMSLI